VPLAACDQAADAPAAAVSAAPPAVTVITLQSTEFTPGFDFMVEQRLFEEGADVAAGDLLFVLEKDQYQSIVEQQRAELASAEANKANTGAQLERGEELVRNGNIPRSEGPAPGGGSHGGSFDPGGAGGAPAGPDQPGLHRDPRADRRPHQPC
jgi:hypothetical protein